jgi:hypothetical protein
MGKRMALRFGVVTFAVSWICALLDRVLDRSDLAAIAASVTAGALLGALAGRTATTRGQIVFGIFGWSPLVGAAWAWTMAWLGGVNEPPLVALAMGAAAAVIFIPGFVLVAVIDVFEPLFKNSNTCSNRAR